ncbi:MAG: 50S ribosomal protein L13 [Chthonomonadales bacterium]|nr:50S ribosomal protein L13 [Chthonomonadales bacterium]
MKTYSAKQKDIEQRTWWVLDAAGRSMGRVATDAAKLLRGKHKPIFTPHVDTGDFVIIVNASRAVLTGNKGEERIYRHSGWPGALKSKSRAEELEARPEEAMRRVVRGMIPHNRLGDAIINKLKVYAGPDHPHQAQGPKVWNGPAESAGG